MDFKLSTGTTRGFDGLLVSVEGELDISTAEQLDDPVEVAVSVACPLVLDLSECSFIDSTGLWSVLRARRALAEAGQAMALVVDRHSQVSQLLGITATDLNVFETCDEAIAWLRTQEAEVPIEAVAPPVPASKYGGPSSVVSPGP
jgi:anti-anti-sigma factor